MADSVKIFNEYSNRDLEQRKVWYTPVVEAYDRGRPRYPEALIQRAMEAAHLCADSTILEVGGGSGIATIHFAQLGCAIDVVEPNPAFSQVAERRLAAFPKVQLFQQSFEEWQVKPQAYEIVLAANAWHWISSDIKYVKASQTLRADGSLVLLWNLTLEPSHEMYQVLNQVYQAYAPASAPEYEGREKQAEIVAGLGKSVGDSGLFEPPSTELIPCEQTYSVDRYLDYLSSGSQYVALESQVRANLFSGLRSALEQQFEGEIQLFNLAALQIARKI